MVNCHIGHDAQFGSKCIIGNNAMIAGHVVCGDGVAMMGGVGVHHFVTIGEYAYIAGYSRVHHDVPPFVKVDGADRVRALNAVGLKRHGFTEDDVDALEDATRRLFFGREKPFNVTLAEFDLMNGINPHVKRMIDFLHRRNQGKHGRYLEAQRGK
jgi:UDP-N-acetylglucosamine acyltransferase